MNPPLIINLLYMNALPTSVVGILMLTMLTTFLAHTFNMNYLFFNLFSKSNKSCKSSLSSVVKYSLITEFADNSLSFNMLFIVELMLCLEVAKSTASCDWFNQTEPSRSYKDTFILPSPDSYRCVYSISLKDSLGAVLLYCIFLHPMGVWFPVLVAFLWTLCVNCSVSLCR